MKTTIKLFSLLTAMLMFVACTPDPVEIERDIVYTVDNTTTTVHLRNDTEFDALLDRFCDYAESGSNVTFYNANRSGKTIATKDITRFSTTSRQEMKRWMRAQENAGKTVTVTYDSGTGTYHGMAYTNAPNSNWVNLGLPSGLLWARCNVGATAPEEYGNYYAWGETQAKTEYSWYTYRYGIGYNYLTKYCNMSDFGHNGFTDTLTILEPNDDAATSNTNNGRTPTESEWNELIQYCTGEWTTQNGVNGYRFTGPNGNSIFLPAAGKYDASGSSVLGSNEWGLYWSASLYTNYPCTAINFHFMATEAGLQYNERTHGLPVRAVRDTQQ